MITPLILAAYILVLICVTINLITEYARDLMMMQQNSYRVDRYFRWLKSSGDTTSYQRLIGFCVAFLVLVAFTSQLWCMVLIGLFVSGNAIYLLSRKYKKPLVWTKRARRIYFVMILLSLIVEGIVTGFTLAYSDASNLYLYCAAGALFLYCCSHVVMVISVGLLSPVEKMINRRYYNEAADILAGMPALTVIGVTGSYGKTST